MLLHESHEALATGSRYLSLPISLLYFLNPGITEVSMDIQVKLFPYSLSLVRELFMHDVLLQQQFALLWFPPMYMLHVFMGKSTFKKVVCPHSSRWWDWYCLDLWLEAIFCTDKHFALGWMWDRELLTSGVSAVEVHALLFHWSVERLRNLWTSAQ